MVSGGMGNSDIGTRFWSNAIVLYGCGVLCGLGVVEGEGGDQESVWR